MHTGNHRNQKNRSALISIAVAVMLGFYGCSSPKKSTDPYGPEPEPVLGPPQPEVSATPVESYGPTQKKDDSFGVTVVLGAMPKSPGAIIGAIRQIEAEGILVKKIIAAETSAVMAGIHVASESANKSDWNLTQIYKNLEQSDISSVGQLVTAKGKRSLQKKLEQIFFEKNKAKPTAKLSVVNKFSGGWATIHSENVYNNIFRAIKNCGWIDEMGEYCVNPVTKESYLELVKNETTHPVLIVEKETPTEQQENLFFVQIQEDQSAVIDSSSRSKHLFLGKKSIKQEIGKIKTWIKELKEKNESR